MAKSFLDAEREFYIVNGATGGSLAELKKSFYVGQLGAIAGNKTVNELELEWLRKYSGVNSNNKRELWLGVYIAQGHSAESTIPLSQIRYQVYLAQSL